MSANRLPDFERTLAIAQGNLEAPELSECHGIACGLLCRFFDAAPDVFLDLLGVLELVQAPGTGLKMSLEELLIATREQLADGDMSLALWLPADDETLEDRTMAMSQWCSGFLAGLGSGGDDSLKAMTDEGNEALRDLQQISTADVTDTTESEDDENAFAEIIEYIRVVVLIIREDLRGPDNQDQIH
jgi:uncharacterized protein YgfB (UPF0149 family)